MKKIELEKALTINQEDRDSINPNFRRLMEMSPNASITFLSDFAFRCQDCKNFDRPYLEWYRIKKEENPYVETTEGIVHVKTLDKKPEHISSLNYIEGLGYVCDHCKISIYEEDPI